MCEEDKGGDVAGLTEREEGPADPVRFFQVIGSRDQGMSIRIQMEEINGNSK